MTEKPIDTEKARRLREHGLSYKEIGKILANNECRQTPYQGTSVYNAIIKARSSET